MSYAIEKRNSEWVVFAGGLAILRCAQADMALEVTRMAREQLSDSVRADGGDEDVSESPPQRIRYG